MGGSSKPSTDWNQVAAENAYNAAAQGQPREYVISNTDPKYYEAVVQGYDAYKPPTPFVMPEFSFEFPEYESGPSYEEQMADQEARYQEQLDEQLRIQGENDRDAIYSAYLDAVGSATDFVNQEITNEMANARLIGTDYSITDEQKSTRISDYFATLWGEGDQTQMEQLMTEWGNPSGFKGFTVKRGDGSVYEGTGGEEKTVSTTTGQKFKPTLATDEEDVLGGATTILGV